MYASNRTGNWLSFLYVRSGGYLEFLKHYRRSCSVTSAKKLHSKRPSNLSLQLSTLSLDTSSPRDLDIAAVAPPSSPSPTYGKDGTPHQILDHLFLGCRKAASTPQKLRELGITRILNVTPVASQVEILDSFMYKQIAVEDSHDVNMLQHLPEAFAFIEDARLRRERVLVHCHAGMSRSVTIILAYLMKYYDHSLESAYDFVKQRKDDIAPNFSFMGQLLEFQSRLSPLGTPDSGIDSPMQITFSPNVPCIMAIWTITLICPCLYVANRFSLCILCAVCVAAEMNPKHIYLKLLQIGGSRFACIS